MGNIEKLRDHIERYSKYMDRVTDLRKNLESVYEKGIDQILRG